MTETGFRISGGLVARRVILATGHRPDAPGRETPRFPSEYEETAKEAIRAAIEKELADAGDDDVVAIAGLASGADILFHELCQEMGIKAIAGLPMSREEFIERSLQESGGNWVERFRKLFDGLEPEVVGGEADRWVTRAGENYPFQRCSMWLATRAFAWPDAEVSVIALWDGKTGDGAGGTADTIEQAKSRGAKIVHLDTRELFEFVEVHELV